MKPLRMAYRLVRKKILLDTLEKSLQFVLDNSPTRLPIDSTLLVARLRNEIEWLKIKIGRLEEK